jgi:hypothetical protein
MWVKNRDVRIMFQYYKVIWNITNIIYINMSWGLWDNKGEGFCMEHTYYLPEIGCIPSPHLIVMHIHCTYVVYINESCCLYCKLDLTWVWVYYYLHVILSQVLKVVLMATDWNLVTTFVHIHVSWQRKFTLRR